MVVPCFPYGQGGTDSPPCQSPAAATPRQVRTFDSITKPSNVLPCEMVNRWSRGHPTRRRKTGFNVASQPLPTDRGGFKSKFEPSFEEVHYSTYPLSTKWHSQMAAPHPRPPLVTCSSCPTLPHHPAATLLTPSCLLPLNKGLEQNWSYWLGGVGYTTACGPCARA